MRPGHEGPAGARRGLSRQATPLFSALLRTLRTAAGLTQEALAERAGVSVRGVQDLERGQSQRPRRDTVALLAAALGLAGDERARFIAAAQGKRAGPLPVGTLLPPVPASALVPLVGRAGELALLERFLSGEGGPLGVPPVLLLAGEPGIGKTRLLQAAALDAIVRGWCVLVGGGQRRGGQEPYTPLVEALTQHLQAAGSAPRRAALAGCAWLVRLLPELAAELEPVPAGGLAPEQERRLLFAAVARCLANVAGPAGTLLVLDDLQWAGSDALDLLASLLRTSALPLRVVGAYRDTEVRPADPLGLLLADLAQARLVRRHALGPLAAQDAAGLLDDLLVDLPEDMPGLKEGVLRRAGGTPFFLISYAQALQQGSKEGVPWDLAQGVRQRVALLPPAGQEVLGVAAVAGRRASRGLLVAVGGPEEAVLHGLEATCRARLLLENGDDAYVFAHDVIREVVEADLGTARRALLHRRVAEALELSHGVSPEELAYHYARGGDTDNAVRYLEQAAAHAWAQRAHGAAEHHYREAVDRLDTMGRVQEAARLRETLADVLFQTGRYAAVIAVLEPAAELCRAAGDGESLGRVMARIGWAYARSGRPREGLARIQPLLGLLDRGEASPALAAVYAALGQLYMTAGRHDDSLVACERAAMLAAGRDDRTQMLAMGLRMSILEDLGRLREALDASQEALPLAEAVGDLDGLLRAHRDLAHILELRGDLTASGQHLDHALAAAAQMGDAGQHAGTLAYCGWNATMRGDMAAARGILDDAVALSKRADSSWYSAYPPLWQARHALITGDWAAASASIQEALALAAQADNRHALRWAAPVMAELDILDGRAEAARARLVPLLDQSGRQGYDVTLLLPMLAWAQLELGEVEQAAQTVEQALTRARREEMQLVLVEALRVRALIALRQERWPEATRSLEEGVVLARAMPHPYAEGRLLHVYGLLHAQQGVSEAAGELLAAALALFWRLGASQDVAQVEQALAALSHNETLFQNTPPSLMEFGPTRLSAAQWTTIAALLPAPARTGRPRADDRQTIEAILYKLRTGCAWNALPAELGNGVTAYRRLRSWQAAGVWAPIVARLGLDPM